MRKGHVWNILKFCLLLHGVAAAVFLVLRLAVFVGCNRGDAILASLAVATCFDLLLVPVLVLFRARARGWSRGAALAGWSLSLIPVVVFNVATLVYIHPISSGCPV